MIFPTLVCLLMLGNILANRKTASKQKNEVIIDNWTQETQFQVMSSVRQNRQIACLQQGIITTRYNSTPLCML